MISLTELNAKIRDALAASRDKFREETSLRDALGKVTTADVTSAVAIPRDDVSAMDGYAVHCGGGVLSSGSRVKLIGESKAGAPFDGQLKAGECVRIMTGAVVPRGADSVVMQEYARLEKNDVTLERDAKRGDNIRYAGEEVAVGDLVLRHGSLITPTEILLLASCGVESVETSGKLKVGVFSTGDELVQPGTPLKKPGEIYDSNRITICALLSHYAVEIVDYGLVEDNLDATKEMLQRASNECDVVITSGGVSVGDYDYLKDAVASLGTIHQYKVQMKPGKPFVFGEIGDAWYFGLPGNPVSVYVGLTQIVVPALLYLLGIDTVTQLSFEVPLAAPLYKRHDRQDFQRGYLSKNEADGKWEVTPQGGQHSHRVYALSQANCFIVLSTSDGNKERGEFVTVIPFDRKFNMGGVY